MNTHNILFQYKKENHPKLSEICSYGIFSRGLKSKFETAVVNEPSVFEPPKNYCICIYLHFFFQNYPKYVNQLCNSAITFFSLKTVYKHC